MTKKKTTLSAAFLALLLACPPTLGWAVDKPKESSDQGQEQKVVVDLGKSGTTNFEATGKPAALKIKGKGGPSQGELVVTDGKKVTGKISFPLNTLDTGVALRNTHMREKYLQTDKYPNAVLEITEMELPDNFSEQFSHDGIPFKGNLTIKNVAKPVEGKAKVERKGQNVAIHTDFDIKISEWPIGVPSFAGVTVADNVKVVADSQAQVKGGKGTA